MSATGPAAVETCPVCGSPMARGERLRVQVLREAPVTWRSRTSWTWQMVGVALDALTGVGGVEEAAPACARAVEGLCAALTELAWTECDRAVYGDGEDECQRL